MRRVHPRLSLDIVLVFNLLNSLVVCPPVFLMFLALIDNIQTAYNPVSFCKCICFNNATIIPITNPVDSSKPCAECKQSPLFHLTEGTRQFCLDYHLPICRGASNDPSHGDDTVIGDISTVCFRTLPSVPI